MSPSTVPSLHRVRALAVALGVYLVVGFAERVDDRMYNSAITVSPTGVIVARYAKTHTAGDDEPFNSKGTEFPVVETPLGRWGTLICMDRQLPETARILAVKGAQLILVPAWGMYGEINDVMMRTRAFENGVYVAFVHPKRCLIIDPEGTIVAQDSGRGDEIVTARITLSGRRSARPDPAAEARDLRRDPGRRLGSDRALGGGVWPERPVAAGRDGGGGSDAARASSWPAVAVVVAVLVGAGVAVATDASGRRGRQAPWRGHYHHWCRGVRDLGPGHSAR